ncbi:magnesium/cobalt transporter CorA [Aeoliella sp. ICT_H6.2]|uniref:Magnesium transport protein CorA n=1 Tax=Aeoliella straminimaris TaxID=2954799 RepID=A0A9X2JI57_9BACT|nr:magnesium/cobalt transporter CorA [Aeoliella straminimaris]MCO6043604.1 magnesium/cobalt transporter CorA [Aeoliella straminimaris]
MLRTIKRRLKSITPRIRRHTPPGAMPGTIKVRRDAHQPTIELIHYTNGNFEERPLNSADDVRPYLGAEGVTWINVEGLGDQAMLEQVGEMFGLHRLAMEDVVNVHQRAKVEEYDDHLFIVVRMLAGEEELKDEQLSIFLGQNFLITIQELPGDCLDPVRARLRKDRGRIRKVGPDYLCYAIIDAVVDAYFPIVDSRGEVLEDLDDAAPREHSHTFMRHLHSIRGELMMLRRAIRPLRDALVRLMPDPIDLFKPETQLYLRDCFDHVVQLMDLLDTYREMSSDLRDYHLSSINHRMNEIMKVLTIIATVFMPLSFITGVYGMNFNTELPGNMPELDIPYAYVVALLVMVGIATGLFAFFYRHGWLRMEDLGQGEDQHERE